MICLYTSGFLDVYTMGPVARIKHDVCSEEIFQVAVPVGVETTTAFGQVNQNAAPGVKFAIYC